MISECLIIANCNDRSLDLTNLCFVFVCSSLNTMDDQTAILTKKAKVDENNLGNINALYNADEFFAKFRPDKESRCTWTKDSCPKESPHLHDENM